MRLRKEDTRKKIQLGGLVVKAGLEDEPTAVLLGLLTLAARSLNGPNAEANRARFEAAGAQAFAPSPAPVAAPPATVPAPPASGYDPKNDDDLI